MLLQILISGLVIGSIYGLVALGYSLIYKSSGLLSFVQGDLLTLGAYLGYTFYLVMVLVFLFGFLLERGVIS